MENQEVKVQKQTAWQTYSEAEKKHYRKMMNELTAMRENMRRSLTEFDDKTYLQSYEENRKADLGYNVATTEEDDFRLTTGLTREKDTTILSTLINFNLQPNITAFEKDNTIISQLGNEMEDLVKKSRELEAYPEKRSSIYRELVAQGTVYVEEVYSEKRILRRYDTSWTPKMKIADYKGDDKPIYNIEGKCEIKLHLGKYVLFSSMNEEELQNNGCVAVYEEIDRSLAEAMFSDWDRWDLVPDGCNNETPFKDSEVSGDGSSYIWNTYVVPNGKVGITRIMKRFENKAMILINGVMMLPIDFPLTKLSPSGLYPIAKGLGERIPNFAIGKGIPSKTRVDQKLYDTLLRAMIGKAWQSYRPALGNRSGNVLTRDIVKANQMTTGIKQNDIFTILPQQLLAVTAGDVSMFNMVKEVINEKSVSDSYGASTTNEGTTATEIINQQKQTMLKLAALVDGVRSLERRLILLRIYNIVANWTKSEEYPMFEETVEMVDGVQTVTGKKIDPTKKVKKYKKFTTDTTLADGTPSVKVTQFVGENEPLPSTREQINQEEDLEKEYGKPVRISYIGAEWLRLLEAIWNVDVIVSNDGDDQMKLLMFIDNLTRVANLFGPQVFKQDYVLGRIAIKMNEDVDKMFNISQGATMQDIFNQINQNKDGKTMVKNPAEQTINAQRPSTLTAAKVV